MANEPVVWSPWMYLVVAPVVLCGVIGLLLAAIFVIILLLLGMKPTSAIR